MAAEKILAYTDEIDDDGNNEWKAQGCIYCDGKLFGIGVYFILMNEIIVNRSAKIW